MTPKQLEAYRLICGMILERGVPPSFTEIAHALNLRSKSGVHRLIESLEDLGYITRIKNKARSIRLARPSYESDVLAFLDSQTRDIIKNESGLRGIKPQDLIAEICRIHYFEPWKALQPPPHSPAETEQVKAD